MDSNTSFSLRDDPKLSRYFNEEHPEDIQVIVHDSGPRLTDVAPELMWAKVWGVNGEIYGAFLLNEPHGLKSVVMGSRIFFLVPPGSEHPVQATEKYLLERPNWKITPCDKCGFDELFDAPSDLIRVIFPNIPADASLEGFTSFCPLCGGVQLVESLASGGIGGAKRPWWQFWKA